MPTYLFKDKTTEREWEDFMTISERDVFLENNPHVEQLVNGCPAYGKRIITQKPNNGHRDLLREMKRKHKDAKINTW